MYMYNLICITNRHLCNNDFLEQIENICMASRGNFKIILREKDLSEEEYEHLADQVLKICHKYNVECVLHTYYNVAKRLKVNKIHLPLNILKNKSEIVRDFQAVGVSIHSREEAEEAERLGAKYITAGHIFNTDCKKGLPGRGLQFLKDVVQAVNIPVYAIGGISSSNIEQVIESGAYGACIMSGFMQAENLEEIFK